jgi:hypothetical protein
VTAARRIGLSLDAFNEALPGLLKRGFPAADQTTGIDLDAIDAWRRTRYPHLFFGSSVSPLGARDAKDVGADRLARIRGG